MPSSYISPVLTVKPTDKKRRFHSEGMKDVKRQDINNEGYSKEKGSGTDDVSFGEDNKDRAPWLGAIHDTHGPNSVMTDKQNWMDGMPGQPYNTFTSMGVTMNVMVWLKKAVKDTFQEQIRRALSRLKEEGKIPPEASLDSIGIKLPSGVVTIDKLSDDLAEQAMKELATNPEGSLVMPKAKEPPAEAGAPPVPPMGDLGLPPMPTETGIDNKPLQGTGPSAGIGGALESAIGNFEQAAKTPVATGAARMQYKTSASSVKERALKIDPSIADTKDELPYFRMKYNHPTHELRKIPEGNSKWEDDVNTREEQKGQDMTDTPSMTAEPTGLANTPMMEVTRSFM